MRTETEILMAEKVVKNMIEELIRRGGMAKFNGDEEAATQISLMMVTWNHTADALRWARGETSTMIEELVKMSPDVTQETEKPKATLASLKGVASIPDGLSSEDFIRKQREGWAT